MPMTMEEMEARLKDLEARYARLEDVAPVVAFLASDVCSYMVGGLVNLSTG